MAGRRRIRVWLKRLAIGAGALVLLLMLAVAAFWLTLPPPVPKADYAQMLVDIAARGQPPESEAANGWPVLIELGLRSAVYEERIDELEEKLVLEATGERGDSTNSGWGLDALTDDSAPAWSKMAARTVYDEMVGDGYFDGFVRVTDARRFVEDKPGGDDVSDWVTFYLERMTGLRAVGRAASTRMQVAAAAGDVGEAAAALDAGVQVVVAAGRQPTILHHLVAVSALSMMAEGVQDVIDAHADQTELMSAFAAVLDRRFPTPTFEKAFEGERAICRALIRPWTSGWLDRSFAALQGRLFAEVTDRVYAEAIRAAAMTRAGRLKAGLTNEHFGRLGQPGWRCQLVLVSGILGASNTGDSVTTCLRNSDSVDVRAKGLRLRLALELHRLRRGSYPESLEVLVPEFIASLPVDTFSPGGRFGYRRLDPSADPHGRGYILYSAGYDGIDNNGTPAPKDDPKDSQSYDALLGKCTGCDYVFNEAHAR